MLTSDLHISVAPAKTSVSLPGCTADVSSLVGAPSLSSRSSGAQSPGRTGRSSGKCPPCTRSPNIAKAQTTPPGFGSPGMPRTRPGYAVVSGGHCSRGMSGGLHR